MKAREKEALRKIRDKLMLALKLICKADETFQICINAPTCKECQFGDGEANCPIILLDEAIRFLESFEE